MGCLWFFCCCRKNNTSTPEPLNIEDIHQYVPFKDVINQPNVYYEALKLKQKLDGHCKGREKKDSNFN
jgi:hypothetical protein